MFFDYGRYFSGNRQHIQKFVGLKHAPGFVSLHSVFDKIAELGLGRPFLKIDIEGSEYRILDDLTLNSKLISGLVIEFHECDLHLERIMDFVKSTSLHLIHIHPNNYSPLSDEDLPLVLEFSFSSSMPNSKQATIPNKLDMPNAPKRDEYALTFKSKA